MNRKELWKKQGGYRTKKGVPMLLVLDKKTQATMLEPLKKRTKTFNITEKN